MLHSIEVMRLKLVQFLPGKQCSTSSIGLGVAILLILFNEFGCFLFSSWLWERLPPATRNHNQLRILFVADPQLIGLQHEPPVLGYLTRLDADRYLRHGFWLALGHVRPDVVVFLGDLLDEGSSGSYEDFVTYVKRFNDIFQRPDHVEAIFISGDNDVGGEGIDRKEDWKLKRFIKNFDKLNSSSSSDNIVQAKFVDFLKLSYNFGDEVTETVKSQWSDMDSLSKSQYRIVINHMTLLERHSADSVEMLQMLKPSIIVTAHTHTTRIFSCQNCRAVYKSQLTKPYPVLLGERGNLIDRGSVVLNMNDANSLYEITVPTCSYRMGVPNMGYGAAVIDADGKVTFTVLWLPSRYHLLAFYVFYMIVAVVLFATYAICSGYRKVASKLMYLFKV